MRRRRWQTILVTGSLILGAAGSCLLPRVARAEPTEAEKRAAAQALFDAGRQLSSQDKFAEACPKLLESYRLDPAMGTKFYLADCYEHTGRLASAWTYYLEVVEQAHRELAREREKFATQRADALKARLPHLVVKRSAAARDTAGLVVTRDGLTIGEGMWDTPVPVDLGAHAVRATAPGKKPLTLDVDVKQEGAELAVEIPALDPLPAAVPLDHPSPEPPPVEPPPPPPVSPARKIAGFTVGGLGVVGLGVGIGFGVQAISKKNASNAAGQCNTADVCTPSGHQLRVDAIGAATVSTAFLVVGGAALATGIVLVATAPSSKPQSDASPEAPPSASLSIGPLGGSFRLRF